MKNKFLFLGLLLPLLFLTACGTQEQTDSSLQEQQADVPVEEESAEPAEEAEIYDSAAESINALGYDLFARLSGDGNVCISPYSIETALGMGANAAADATLDQMLGTMHTTDIHTFNQNISSSMDKLERDAMDIRIANSAWYADDMDFSDSFESSYLPLLTESYNADCFEADFTDASTIDAMNNWIAKATNDKITDMVSDLSEDTCLVLFNAVYFNAEWEVSFPKEATFDEEFHGTDGTQTVPFMHLTDRYFQYYEYKGILTLRMRYKDSDMAMDILIPEASEDKTVTELFNALSFEEKQELYQGLSDSEEVMITSLKMPRFEFSSDSIPLSNYLKDLGMTRAFSDEADLDLISGDAYISDVFHKTYIRVDEKGTEAAAVTEMIMNTLSMPTGEPLLFEVDMPFMYYITDTSDGTILFIGTMNNIN